MSSNWKQAEVAAGRAQTVMLQSAWKMKDALIILFPERRAERRLPSNCCVKGLSFTAATQS